MDEFYERLADRAATIDELLSDSFASSPGRTGDTELATQRLTAWCRSCANDDWSLFDRRLHRDGLTKEQVSTRLATAGRRAGVLPPAWVGDAIWIETTLRTAPHATAKAVRDSSEPFAFEHLFTPLVDEAEFLLWPDGVSANFAASGRTSLRRTLLRELTDLCAPVLYERFTKARAGAPQPISDGETGASHYDQFVVGMKQSGFRELFERHPVLLRLIAVMTRQWIDASRELVLRLDADLALLRGQLIGGAPGRVADIKGDLSDPHNGGRSVQIVIFEDGTRVVYKPKDLRLDVAWHDLVARLNRSGPPLALKAVRAVSRQGYGWTEFIAHTGCTDAEGCDLFFRRAGAWLALFHGFVATDMHQENLIAAGDHPVPIDLETILQPVSEAQRAQYSEGGAFAAAMDVIANSVMVVGLLPAYGRAPDNTVFAMGGMTSDWNTKIRITWSNINSDEMRPAKSKQVNVSNPNLPHIEGRYARFGDHIESFIAGFHDYATFLLRISRDENAGGLFDGFAGAPVRRVIRPTRFYSMLLQRLKNHRTMDDGAIWSAQADFIARLANWEDEFDSGWPLQCAERSALVALNVPHFTTPSDGDEIRDASGFRLDTGGGSGLDRARARMRTLDEREIAWQIEVIRANTNSAARPAAPSGAAKPPIPAEAEVTGGAAKELFVAEAGRIADELAAHAVRRGQGAAWIGLDWLGDAEVFQLVCLGPDLYNGASGIALFLAAYAAVTGRGASGELALAGLHDLRTKLRSRNAARLARSLGTGGATGLGSIVYALTVTSRLLANSDLLADAQAAAALCTDDLIAADKRLDVIGGNAGAILGLLRLYRDTQSAAVLARAIKCGDHLIGQSRTDPAGHRIWLGQGLGARALNGMSHGAGGFAYAFASLAAASGRQDFAAAAADCIAFENSSYDAERHNWPDLRHPDAPGWPSQWCHGAPGIGLARIGAVKRGAPNAEPLRADALNALESAENAWPGPVDTLCCGTLGSIEFLNEAGKSFERSDIRAHAARRLAAVVQNAAASGDYRWNTGKRQFNLGFFRGLAGVGYTVLRQVDESLPNVLIWE